MRCRRTVPMVPGSWELDVPVLQVLFKEFYKYTSYQFQSLHQASYICSQKFSWASGSLIGVVHSMMIIIQTSGSKPRFHYIHLSCFC